MGLANIIIMSSKTTSRCGYIILMLYFSHILNGNQCFSNMFYLYW